MASFSGWCYLHSQAVTTCKHELCRKRANDPSYTASSILETDVVDTLSNMPDAPMSSIEATGIEFHGVYMANIKAGFSAPQALYLLAVQMTGNPGIAPGIESADPNRT